MNNIDCSSTIYRNIRPHTNTIKSRTRVVTNGYFRHSLVTSGRTPRWRWRWHVICNTINIHSHRRAQARLVCPRYETRVVRLLCYHKTSPTPENHTRDPLRLLAIAVPIGYTARAKRQTDRRKCERGYVGCSVSLSLSLPPVDHIIRVLQKYYRALRKFVETRAKCKLMLRRSRE